MAKQRLFKVTLTNGTIALIAAHTLTQAEEEALKEQGTANLRSVELATLGDIAWIEGFGGHVPELS